MEYVLLSIGLAALGFGLARAFWPARKDDPQADAGGLDAEASTDLARTLQAVPEGLDDALTQAGVQADQVRVISVTVVADDGGAEADRAAASKS